MKNFDFNKSNSVFRNQKEGSRFVVSKKINWDRIVYFTLLIVLLVVVVRYSYFKIFYVKADGQVIFNSVDIQTLNDSRIVSLPVHEGDEVKIGDTLFVYEEDNGEEKDNSSISLNHSGSSNNWKEKEYIEINNEIQIKNNELNFMMKKLIRLKTEEEKVKNEVMVDALPKVEYHRLKNSINDLDQEIQLVKKEIEILMNKLISIRNVRLLSSSNVVGTSRANSSELPKVFISPIEGFISKIFKENYEVALRSDVVMHLYQPKGVIVKAFFQQKDYNQIKKGDIVEVEFPDGRLTKGIISMVLYETNRLPEEFQKKFEPTTRVINADIVPFSKKDLMFWKKYNKLSVIVRKEKY